MGLNPNADSQHDELRDDKSIELLVANTVGLVEERVTRSTRDTKGSRPAM